MPDIGSSAKIINASRVNIFAGTGNKITLTSDVKIRIIRTADRINTRAGAIDTFRWRLSEIEFTAAQTKDLLAVIVLDTTLTAASALPTRSWIITGLSISGAAAGADDTSQTFVAEMLDSEELAPENGIDLVRIKLRVVGGAN